MDGKKILDLEMEPNDAEATTIREYLKALLEAVWSEGEGFSGKRPFGNSSWEYDLYRALVKGGSINGKFAKPDPEFPDDLPELLSFNEKAADKAIHAAIDALT